MGVLSDFPNIPFYQFVKPFIKNMKKVILTLLTLALAVLFIYLLYKSWMIFGWWTLTWTGIVSLLSNFVLDSLTTARSEENGIVTFNPKEWPKYISMAISLAIAYYLFSIINVPNINQGDYIFGISYLLTLTVFPLIFGFYFIFKNKNDSIVFEAANFSYRDNDQTGAISYKEIAEAKMDKGIVEIKLTNAEIVSINLQGMNFNKKDQEEAFGEIAKRIA
ncbi:MAG: hypothetical protein RLZZ44_1176 [Bacteroidota bacterium]